MITTAVHQASQLVDIQGAPQPVEADGGDFRAAFTASVDQSTSQKAAPATGQTPGAIVGAASTKHPPAAASTARATSRSAQASPRLKTAGPEEAAVETAASPDAAPQAAPTTDFALVSDLVLGSALADAAKAAASELLGNSALKSAAPLPLSLPAAANAASAIRGSKNLPADKPSETATVPALREQSPSGPSAANKDATGPAIAAAASPAAQLASVAIVSPGVPLDAAAIAQALQPAALAAASLSQGGTDQGVLTGVSGASGVARTASLNATLSSPSVPSRSAAGGSSVPAVTGGNGSGASQPGVSNATASLNKFASEVAAANLKGGAQSDSILAAGQPARSYPSALTETAGGVDGKTGSLGGPAEAQSKGSVQPHPAQTERPLSPLPSSRPGSDGAEPAQLSIPAGQPPTDGEVSADGGATAIPGTPAIAAQGQWKTDPPVGVPRTSVPSGVAPAALPIAQAAPGSADAVKDAAVKDAAAKDDAAKNETFKDDRTKAVGSASESTGSSRSVAAPALSGDASGESRNLAAGEGGAALRAVPDAAAQSLQAAGHFAASSAHGVVASSPAGPAHAPGAVNAASLAEPASAPAQAGDSHRTLLATPTALEVGVQSGTQGWLRIRAEVGGAGEVNASLSAASSGGRELLHSQLPALNAFLHSEQLSVTATVAERGVLGAAAGQQGTAFGSGSLGTGLGAGLGTGAGSDASGGSHASLLQGGGASNGGSQRESAPQPAAIGATERTASYDANIGVNDAAGLGAGNATVSGDSGRWLNVRV